MVFGWNQSILLKLQNVYKAIYSVFTNRSFHVLAIVKPVVKADNENYIRLSVQIYMFLLIYWKFLLKVVIAVIVLIAVNVTVTNLILR